MLRTPDDAYWLSQKYAREYVGKNVLNVLDKKIADEVEKQIAEIDPSSQGATSYTLLANKPQINDHELSAGSNTLLQLGIAVAKTTAIDNMFK